MIVPDPIGRIGQQQIERLRPQSFPLLDHVAAVAVINRDPRVVVVGRH
jgi:hypothetical protein